MKLFEEKLWVALGVLLFIGVVLATCLISSTYAVDTEYSIAYRKHDGLKNNLAWIPCDPEIDSDDFTLCSERTALAYFRGKPGYIKEGRSLQEILVDQFSSCPIELQENGFLTLRFMINCEGQIGRIRASMVNNQFDPIPLPKLTTQIVAFLNELDEWKPYSYKNNNYDVISFIHCKIENGSVTKVS